MEQVNLRLTPEVFSKFKENYENLRNERKVLTLNEFTELLLDNYKKLPLIIEKEVEKPLNQNQVIINVPPWVKVLLEVTAKRLTEKLKKIVTPEAILLSIFARYTVERNSEIFYDFMLNKDELEKLTGYRREHLIARAKALL